MEPCAACTTQTGKKQSGKPHDQLARIDEPRLFRGRAARGFAEQDYQCLACGAKFTHSTDKNDLAWTLWRA